MACDRGRATPDQHTKLRLFADSGGYCQNPSCTSLLFMSVGNERLHVAEIAHVCAAEERGPRANTALTPEQRGEYDNLILLCPTCHTVVDKAPEAFPDSLMHQWKRMHVDKLATVFAIHRYSSRVEVRTALIHILGENRTVHEEYGPDNDYRYNPESERAGLWQRKVRTRILPNNRKIIALLDANRDLMTDAEKRTAEMLRQHVDDLEARHIDADETGGGARFPSETHNLFSGDANG